jgi:hypothetical protein
MVQVFSNFQIDIIFQELCRPYRFEFIQPEMDFAESVGWILLRDQGPMLFRDAVEKALKNPSAHCKLYLAVIDELACSMPVWTCSVKGLQGCEVDYPADLKQAEKVVSACEVRREKDAADNRCRITEMSFSNHLT